MSFIFLFWHYFDIFLNPHFSFFVCDGHIVVISKVHYESIIFLEFIKFFVWWFPLKFITTWIIKELAMLILNMALNFMFVCNPKKIQVWQSKLSTYSCFHPSEDVPLNWIVLGWSNLWIDVGGVAIMWGDVCTYRLNKFFNPTWIVHFNDPQKWRIMPFIRWGWRNIKTLSWCLQMFPCCAWMQLQHAHSDVGLWIWDDMTNAKPTS